MAKTPQKSTPRRLELVGDPVPATIRFGIILNVNGTSVPVTSEDVSTALTKGVEFTLQNAVSLGSIDLFEDWVSKKFKVDMPKASSLPKPLSDVVGVITGMYVTVEKAHIKVPPSGDSGSVGYTLEVNGTFQPEIPLIPGTLGIQGMVFGFSNEPAES